MLGLPEQLPVSLLQGPLQHVDFLQQEPALLHLGRLQLLGLVPARGLIQHQELVVFFGQLGPLHLLGGQQGSQLLVPLGQGFYLLAFPVQLPVQVRCGGLPAQPGQLRVGGQLQFERVGLGLGFHHPGAQAGAQEWEGVHLRIGYY